MYSLYLRLRVGSHIPEFRAIFGYSRLSFRCISPYELGLTSSVGILSLPNKYTCIYLTLNLRPIWQELPLVAKLFVPSVRCPVCNHANDSDFRFCQHCGYTRKILSSINKSGSLKVDLNSIDKRLQQLLNFDQATSYSKQKDTGSLFVSPAGSSIFSDCFSPGYMSFSYF